MGFLAAFHCNHEGIDPSTEEVECPDCRKMVRAWTVVDHQKTVLISVVIASDRDDATDQYCEGDRSDIHTYTSDATFGDVEPATPDDVDAAKRMMAETGARLGDVEPATPDGDDAAKKDNGG